MIGKQGQAMRPALILPAGGKTGKQNSVLNFATVASSFSVSVPICKTQPSFRVVIHLGPFVMHIFSF